MSHLIGSPAPNFVATAVMPDNSINESFDLLKFLNGRIGVLFFYPLDFTFVCPTEIITFDKKLPQFKELEAEVVGVSVDSQFSHLAYKNTRVENGGIGRVDFPLVADITKDIARSYGVLLNNSVALRGTFLIDQDGNIRHQVVNDLPLGRNVDEARRMVEALKFYQENGEVCPANWTAGDEGMKPTASGVSDYLAKHMA